MRRTIYKYPLVITDEQRLDVPLGTRFLSVALQNDILTVWALVDAEQPMVARIVRIYGTGNPVDDFVDNAEFLGTVLDPRGFVWHVWVEGRLS